MELNQIKNDQELYNKLIQEVPYRIILVNSRHSVLTYNSMAQELCENISCYNRNITDPVSTFVKNTISGIINDQTNTSMLNVNGRSYNLNIVSSFVFNAHDNLDKYFLIYMNKPGTLYTDPNILLASTYNLTGRELEIVELIANGLNNKEIADKLFISFNTVRKHVENIRDKVGAKNRATVLHKLGKSI